MGRECVHDVALDNLHCGAARVGRRHIDANLIAFERYVAHNSQLDDVDHRNLGILHFVQDSENLLARETRDHHDAPGYDLATICISESMWPRCSVCRPCLPPVIAGGSFGISSVARRSTSETIVSHLGRIASRSAPIPASSISRST